MKVKLNLIRKYIGFTIWEVNGNNPNYASFLIIIQVWIIP